MLQNPLLDQRYRLTALGPEITAFLGWLENERSASPRTIDDYERTLARVAIHFPTKPAAEFAKDDVRAGRDLFPPGSRHKALATLRSFFSWLEDEDRIPNDPARKITYPQRKARKIHHLFSEAEDARLSANGPETRYGRAIEVRDKACILILLDGLLRAAEVRALRVEDVDLVDRLLIVRHGKGDKERVVPIAADGRLLKALRVFMTTELPKLGRYPQEGDHILYPFGAGPHGITWVRPEQELTYSPYWYWWRGCCERAKVRYRSGHTARHTGATAMIRSSGAERTKKILGHASIRTTDDEYGHLNVEDARDAVERREGERESA